jgi:hypothetical protein
MALPLERDASLGFSGGGSAVPATLYNQVIADSFVQSCDGLRFSGTDQMCPFSHGLQASTPERISAAQTGDYNFFTPYTQACDGLRFSGTNQLCPFGSGDVVGAVLDSSDAVYTPLTQSCDDLRFSGTDAMCLFSEGLGSGVDLASNGGLGDPYPETQSCDGLRFSGTDQTCPVEGEGYSRTVAAPLPGDPPVGNPSTDPDGQVNSPATLALMGLSLLALGYFRRRRFRLPAS